MATIGSVVLRLEAQHEALVAGLNKGGKAVHQFGDEAGGLGEKLKAGLEIGAGIEIARAGIELVTEGIKMATEAVKEWVAESLKSAKETMRTAEALHIHVDTLAGLSDAAKDAGVEHEQLQNALEKLNVKIGEAATKGGETSEVFKKLGLDAGKLANQNLDKSIHQISDALAAVKNPAQQFALTADLLGEKVGGKLVTTLNQGSAAIDKMAQHARKIGTSLGDIDTAKLAAAQGAFDEVGRHFDGIKNEITLAVAPMFLSIAEHIQGILPSADKMKSAFANAFGVVVMAGAKVMDVLKYIILFDERIYVGYIKISSAILKVAAAVVNVAVSVGKWFYSFPMIAKVVNTVYSVVKAIGGAIIHAGEWVWNKVQALIRATESLLHKIPGFGGKNNNAASEMLDQVAASEDKVADKIDGVADSIANTDFAGKAAGWMTDIQTKAQDTGKAIADGIDKPIGAAAPAVDESAKKITEILDKLKETAATTGSNKPKEIFDLEKLHASKDQIEEAKRILDTIEKKKITIEVDKSLGEMAKEIATFGMDAGHKKLFDLEAMGASQEQIKLAQMYVDKLDELEAKKKEQEEASEIIKKQMGDNPLSKYQSELAKLDKLHKDGLLSAQQYAAGLADANKDLAKSFKSLTEDRKVEAQTRRMDFKGPASGPPKADPIKQMQLEIAKQQKESLVQSQFYLQQLWQFGMNGNQDQDTLLSF